MSPFSMNTSLKPLPPLSDRRVNDALLQTTPNFHQTLLEFVNTVQSGLVDTLLHDPPKSCSRRDSGLAYRVITALVK
jgi:hypothetical protein